MRYCFNPYRSVVARRRATGDARAFHRSLEGYAPTQLHVCTALAERLGLGCVYVKDEAARFGLNAFKALGASWAMAPFAGRAVTFASATDGNHGRAVAWMARRMGCAAEIFVPANMAAVRMDALRSEGAGVTVVEGSYDDAVRRCAAESAANGWQVISDTGYPGYTEIPERVVEGYGTLFEEAEEQMIALAAAPPSLVMVQAGVGGLLSAAVRHFRGGDWGSDAVLACVEPDDADCLLESILSKDGEPSKSRGSQNSIMSGLNCGEVSLAAWPLNRAGVDLFLSVEDRLAEDAMRTLYRPAGGDPRIVAGESGAAGLAGLLAVCADDALAARLGLSRETTVLLLNTEGATDPEAFRRIVEE